MCAATGGYRSGALKARQVVCPVTMRVDGETRNVLATAIAAAQGFRRVSLSAYRAWNSAVLPCAFRHGMPQ
jgi:hypothetical protein